MPMATIEEHTSTSNPLTLTIMFLIQKEMSPIFLQRNTHFMIRSQPTVKIYVYVVANVQIQLMYTLAS